MKGAKKEGPKSVVEVVESKEMTAEKAVSILIGVIQKANTVKEQETIVELLRPVQVAFDEMNVRVQENKKRRMLMFQQVYNAWQLGGEELATKTIKMLGLGENFKLDKFVEWYERELRLAEAKAAAERKAAERKAATERKAPREKTKNWIVSWNDVVVPQPSPYACWRTVARQADAKQFFTNGDTLKGRFDYAAFREAHGVDQRGKVVLNGTTYTVKHVNDDVTTYKVADGFIG